MNRRKTKLLAFDPENLSNVVTIRPSNSVQKIRKNCQIKNFKYCENNIKELKADKSLKYQNLHSFTLNHKKCI